MKTLGKIGIEVTSPFMIKKKTQVFIRNWQQISNAACKSQIHTYENQEEDRRHFDKNPEGFRGRNKAKNVTSNR